jgi:hypothetical protein
MCVYVFHTSATTETANQPTNGEHEQQQKGKSPAPSSSQWDEERFN